MKTASTFAALLAISFVAACGGGGGGDDDDDDSPDASIVVNPDANEGNPDAAEVTCTVAANLGAATPTNTVGQADPLKAPTFVNIGGLLNADTAPDALQLEVYSGFGTVPKGALTTGTYTITGEELNYATCGVCIRAFSDINTGTGESVAQYFATGGTVEITSVSPTFTANLSNVTMETVTIDPTTFESTPVGDGCVTSITSATLSATLTQAE